MTGTEQGSADIVGEETGQQYYLVFPGNVLPGSNYNQSITYLADLLKTSLYKAKKLVSGKKRYIKRKFPRSQAEILRDQVLGLGVACELKAAREKDLAGNTVKQGLPTMHTAAQNMRQSKTSGAEPAAQTAAENEPATEKSYSETMNRLQAIADGLRKGKSAK